MAVISLVLHRLHHGSAACYDVRLPHMLCVYLRLQIWARVEQLGVEDSRPTRMQFTIDEAGQCAMPLGAIHDNERFNQLFAQGRLGDAAWQPVLLQRVRKGLQLTLPPALAAAAFDGQLIDLQVAGACWL